MIDAFCAKAEALCRRIAPLDLGDAPLYIVPQSRVPANLGGKSVCDGFTAPSLDLYLKDVIGPGWRGRGGCIVVNDTDFGGMDAADIETAVSAIALHELAHILERPALYRDRRGEDPLRVQLEALIVGQMIAEDTATAKPFDGHGAGFIRAALHLRHRADVAGMLIPLFYYCAGNHYGLSHPSRYREALGDEPARLAEASFKQILASPYPTAFWRLWTVDTAQGLSPGCSESERSLSA
jgi:hypothetical protein